MFEPWARSPTSGFWTCPACSRPPWATQILGDLGAEVIKIEKPGEGDETRHFGPPFVKAADGARGRRDLFPHRQPQQESVTIDFSRPEGAALVKRLARAPMSWSRISRPARSPGNGLDYASLAADNPALIYCSLTGFGHDGPKKDKAGYDYLIQGMGGLMSITGQPDGAPGAEPMKVGVAVSDLVSGLYTAIAIQAALLHQARTGEGQSIDMALFDCQAAALANQATNSGGRHAADQARQRPSQHRALSGLRGRRRPSDPGRRQRPAVRELRCGRRRGGARCRSPFRDQCRARGRIERR